MRVSACQTDFSELARETYGFSTCFVSLGS